MKHLNSDWVRHLPDLVLFCVTTPIALVALLLHW